ncbi:Uncharacterised protein [Bordetella ansorpii]|uniref:DUF2946 domain-containing protein n=1 Tax=Bordetella ansorpii TaxID=288768 RepID=A0A157SWG1_9BORD|nr:hypothetical protein [Bordetella ansorpii]SAI74769.1 Uncharacterised protein [Bordetella ansorpii]
MPVRRIGPLAFLPRQPLARLAALLWLLACILGTPAAATLHVLSHVASTAASTRDDAPATHHDDQCELCAAWHELGSALPSTPPLLPAATPRALPPVLASAPSPGTAAPRWFHPRAPPVQA